MHAIRCDHDGLKMAEVQNGYLILRAKHHGETHVKIVSLAELVALGSACIEPVPVAASYRGHSIRRVRTNQ